MANAPDVSKQFQRRRKETWRLAKPWLVALLLAGAPLYWMGDLDGEAAPERVLMFVAFFGILLVSVWRIVWIVQKTYRCPACDRVPMSRSSGVGTGGCDCADEVDLNPKSCPGCGARLA